MIVVKKDIQNSQIHLSEDVNNKKAIVIILDEFSDTNKLQKNSKHAIMQQKNEKKFCTKLQISSEQQICGEPSGTLWRGLATLGSLANTLSFI